MQHIDIGISVQKTGIVEVFNIKPVDTKDRFNAQHLHIK